VIFEEVGKEIYLMSSTTTTTTWNLDAGHSSAGFKVRHMMISHSKGEFSGLSGVLTLDEADYTRSTVEASIPVATLRTGDDSRDDHLKNADFFDVEKFPTMTFKSTNIKSTGARDFAVTGDLTIRGITKSVTLIVEDVSGPSKDPWGNQRIGLSASTKINRQDFGLTWNSALEAGGVLVGDEVTITLDVQFIKG
jgi:polyisoprenoid-binding protein YceI